MALHLSLAVRALAPSNQASQALASGEWPFPPPSANRAPTGMQAPGRQGGTQACRSVNVMATDSWCQSACAETWNAEICDGMCHCPQRKQKLQQAKQRGPAPEPPDPRILGGWTDCGPNSGVAEWQKKFVGKKEFLNGECADDEHAIRGALPIVREKASKREPSFAYTWGSNAILPGKFGGSQRAPIVGKSSDYKYYWLTFGGQDTDSAKWMRTAEQEMLAAGANGAAFDIEGVDSSVA